MIHAKALLASITLAIAVIAQDATPVPAPEPGTEPAQPPPAPTDDDIAHWLAGLPSEGVVLQNFTLVPSRGGERPADSRRAHCFKMMPAVDAPFGAPSSAHHFLPFTTVQS